MLNRIASTLKYIDGRLIVWSGDTSDSYAVLFFDNTCSVCIFPLSAPRCVPTLMAARKYLESAMESLPDGVVSQKQHETILGLIKKALCLHYSVEWTYDSLDITPFVLIPVVNIMSGDCEKIIILSVVGNSEQDYDSWEAKLHAIIPYYDCLCVDMCEFAPNEWSVIFHPTEKCGKNLYET